LRDEGDDTIVLRDMKSVYVLKSKGVEVIKKGGRVLK
jgi:hypothetical protein